ncbi:MAG: hypothetical protein MUF61_02420 [archaeon]|nr:hypothetical protein [archaeon]
MTPKRAELLKKLCLSYVHELCNFKAGEIRNRLEEWLDRFKLRDSTGILAEKRSEKIDLMERLDRHRRIYLRATNPSGDIFDEAILRLKRRGK